VCLIKAGESDFLYVKNLVPYYIYDMSQYLNWNPDSEGRYDGCDDLPEYWKNETWRPFLIKVDGTAGGFAMIRPYPDEPDIMDVGEFFILRKFTGQGVGRKSAFSLFDSFAGNWLVRVLNEIKNGRGNRTVLELSDRGDRTVELFIAGVIALESRFKDFILSAA